MGCAASAIKNIDILETLNQGTEDQADVVEVHYFGIYGRASPLDFLLNHAGIDYERKQIGPVKFTLGSAKKTFGSLPVM